jgi:hypothetical protein
MDMLWYERMIIMKCHKNTGLKLQQMIHCISLTLRTSKGLAKEILYEMFYKGYIDVKLVELVDEGCDGCSTDITRFSKKACKPQGCLILIHFKRGTITTAIAEETKLCLRNEVTLDTCIRNIMYEANIYDITPDIIAEAINTVDYKYFYNHIASIGETLSQSIANITAEIEAAKQQLGIKSREEEIRELLSKLDEINSDNPQHIRTKLSGRLYTLFMLLLKRGELIYDYTTRQWTYEPKQKQ